ncbi:MAG TPA: biotin-dependent carboxyltransferase family protein [Fimbriimonadaceae bacterium]|nr:biotin-dependent carboxyltransferase family protein [Fimbriimonadaceae bacterium]
MLRIAAGSTLQDGGRPGWRRFGVPAGGAFDRTVWRLGKAFLGECVSGLEMPLLGGSFQAIRPVQVLVMGSGISISLDGLPARAYTRLSLATGSVLEVKGGGARAYLFARGGFSARKVLGSVSGHAVGQGDELVIDTLPPLAEATLDWEAASDSPLRVIRSGLHDSAFEALVRSAWSVSPHSARTGIRLQGPDMPVLPERPSEPACVGAIQLPPGGEPIILGPDGPTIGGYPKIAYVADIDLDRLAQLAPGATVSFREVSLAEARTLAVRLEQSLNAKIAQIHLGRLTANA